MERELDSRSSYCFSSQTSSFPHIFSFSPQFPTKLFTRLKSLCLSVTEHALSSDNWSAQKKKWAGKHFLMWRNSFDVSCAECPSLVSVSLVDPYCNSFLVHTSGNTLLHAEPSFLLYLVSWVRERKHCGTRTQFLASIHIVASWWKKMATGCYILCCTKVSRCQLSCQCLLSLSPNKHQQKCRLTPKEAVSGCPSLSRHPLQNFELVAIAYVVMNCKKKYEWVASLPTL